MISLLIEEFSNRQALDYFDVIHLIRTSHNGEKCNSNILRQLTESSNEITIWNDLIMN